MIPRIPPAEKTRQWQHLLTQAITSADTLYQYLGLDMANLPGALQAARQFRVMVPPGYLRKIQPGEPSDPLLLQVLPQAAEVLPQPPGYTNDPVGDHVAAATPGLIHKYHGRVLLIATGACAVHCRYCFRRHYPYDEASASPRQLESALDYIRRHSDIEEVILSGGDPLMLSDERFHALLASLEAIPHLQRLRIHSRLPIVLPERITPDLTTDLSASRLRAIMVMHCNHPSEIDNGVVGAIDALHRAGIILFNQSVLLRGVNDSAETLESLCKQLFSHQVQPYYLHLLDRVAGAAHFEIDESEATSVYAELAARLPGYMMPRLSREVAGDHSKRIIGSAIG